MSLGEISEKIHYGYTASAKETGNVKLLRITDIQNGVVNWSSVPFCYATGKEIEKFKLNYGDIVIARTGGTIGKSYLIAKKTKEIAVFASYLIRVKPKLTYVNPSYLFNFFDSPFYWTQLFDGSRGTGQPNVNAHALSKIKVPLPSIEEQCRIVTRVNKLFDQIDYAERAYNELSGPLSERLRQLCLEKAIQGKLVPQLESEPEVTSIVELSEDPPFSIPEKWKWTCLKNVTTLISGRDLEKSQIVESPGGIPYITGASQIQDETIIVNRWTKSPAVFSELGDVLLTCKGTVGKIAINNVGRIHIARQIMAIRSSGKVDTEYLKYFLTFYSKSLASNAKSMIPGIDRKTVLKMPIPIPPLTEQHRIVEKISWLFSQLKIIC